MKRSDWGQAETPRSDEVAPRPNYDGRLNLPKYQGRGATSSQLSEESQKTAAGGNHSRPPLCHISCSTATALRSV